MKGRDWSKWRMRIALGLVGGLLVTGVALVLRAIYLPPPTEEQGPVTFNFPGWVRPPATPAAAAGIKDNDEIVGVVVDGRARAYRVGSLDKPGTHVVNDVVADHPVTVTFCRLTKCIQVFTGPGDSPLDVGNGGYDGGLLLLVNGHRYHQNTGESTESDERLQFPKLDFVRTTWKKWRDAHPDTDVVGATGVGG